MYVLWNTVLGGWFTKSATYHSDFNKAQQFDWAEAEKFCRTRKQDVGDHIMYGMLPVRVEDLEKLG